MTKERQREGGKKERNRQEKKLFRVKSFKHNRNSLIYLLEKSCVRCKICFLVIYPHWKIVFSFLFYTFFECLKLDKKLQLG